MLIKLDTAFCLPPIAAAEISNFVNRAHKANRSCFNDNFINSSPFISSKFQVYTFHLKVWLNCKVYLILKKNTAEDYQVLRLKKTFCLSKQDREVVTCLLCCQTKQRNDRKICKLTDYARDCKGRFIYSNCG